MIPYYQDDAVTLYHGDCLDILPRLPVGDLVLTDPPYVHKHVDGGGFAAARKFYAGGSLDGLSDFVLSDYADVLLAAAPMMVAFHSRDLVPDYAALARSSGRAYDLHVWHKVNAIPFTANTWKSDVEYIALIWAQKPGWVQLEQSMHSKVFSSALNIDASHPTAKPLAVLRKYLSVLDAQSIIDPFAGSGTTGAAAKLNGRKAILIEREEKYCEVAAKRLRETEPGRLFDKLPRAKARSLLDASAEIPPDAPAQAHASAGDRS